MKKSAYRLLGAALALAFGASSVRAAGGRHHRGGQNAPAVSSQTVVDDAAEEEKPREEMTLEDAGVDFETVVRSYVGRRTVDGVWPYKAGARTWRLKLAEFSVKNLRKTGVNRFTGAVALRDGKTARILEFAVDFAGADWKVISVKPIRGQKAAK